MASDHGFRNSIKTWGRNEGFSDYLMDAYVDHSLHGLDKSYRREDLSAQIENAIERLLEFVECRSE